MPLTMAEAHLVNMQIPHTFILVDFAFIIFFARASYHEQYQGCKGTTLTIRAQKLEG